MSDEDERAATRAAGPSAGGAAQRRRVAPAAVLRLDAVNASAGRRPLRRWIDTQHAVGALQPSDVDDPDGLVEQLVDGAVSLLRPVPDRRVTTAEATVAVFLAAGAVLVNHGWEPRTIRVALDLFQHHPRLWPHRRVLDVLRDDHAARALARRTRSTPAGGRTHDGPARASMSMLDLSARLAVEAAVARCIDEAAARRRPALELTPAVHARRMMEGTA